MRLCFLVVHHESVFIFFHTNESGGQTTVERAALSPRWTKVRSRENTNEDSTTEMPQGTGGRSRRPMSRMDL